MAIDLPDAEARRGAPFHAYPRSFIGKHILCREALFRGIGQQGKVLELFGGLGCSSVLLREYCQPYEHLVIERDPHLATHIRGQGFAVRWGDVYENLEVVKEPRDLVDADFGDFTIHHWRTNLIVQEIWEQLFSSGHRKVVTTDIAGPHLHLHRERYEGLLLLPCDTYEHYVTALSAFMYDLYGYSVARAEYHHGSCSMLWLPGEGHGIAFERTEAAYEGVALC